MATVSTIVSSVSFFFLLNDEMNDFLHVLAIIFIVLLILGNIMYFFSAYFAYSIFEDKFFQRLGAKVKFHDMFKWVQFNNSCMKNDLGFFLMLVLGTYIFDYHSYMFCIVETVLVILSIGLIIILRRSLRKEDKRNVCIVIVTKIFIFAYLIMRIIYLMDSDLFKAKEGNEKYAAINIILLIVFGICNFCNLFLIIFSSCKSITLFGTGLKEVLLSQKVQDIQKDESKEEIEV